MFNLSFELTTVALSLRFIMAELLQTERAYVKDLETCITCYLREMRTDPAAVPQALQGKVCILVDQEGNIGRNMHTPRTVCMSCV